MNTKIPALKLQSKKWLKNMIPVIIAVTIIIIASVIWSSQGASQGVITQGAPVIDVKSTPSKEKIRMDGKYLSFAYLASYVPAENTDASTKKTKEIPSQAENLLQSSFLVSYSTISSKKLAVSVEYLRENTLAGNTSFTFRAMNPKMYVQSEETINNEQSIVFTKNDSLHEVALFMKHTDKTVSVVLSSSNESFDAMYNEMLAVTKSIEWKN